MKSMNHRAVSFANGHFDADLLKLSKKLGFNAVEFQIERGNIIPLSSFAADAKKNEYPELIKQIGMKAGVWVHELEDYEEAWGGIEVGNDKLWKAIDGKYEYIFNKLLPWVDYIILTTVETEINLVSEPEILLKLIQVIGERCIKEGKKMVLRSFVWEPSELEVFKTILPRVSNEIVIMTKCVSCSFLMKITVYLTLYIECKLLYGITVKLMNGSM